MWLFLNRWLLEHIGNIIDHMHHISSLVMIPIGVVLTLCFSFYGFSIFPVQIFLRLIHDQLVIVEIIIVIVRSDMVRHVVPHRAEGVVLIFHSLMIEWVNHVVLVWILEDLLAL